MHVQNNANMAPDFPRGFELTAQILLILDLAHFNGQNKPQVEELSVYF